MDEFRTESDSMGEVKVPADKLWGAQTQRALLHFAIGDDPMPRRMITAYAIVKKAAAIANAAGGRLPDEKRKLIVQACDELIAGEHADMFPLNVWMAGSGTPFNMNVNEVIANRCAQIAGKPLGSKQPVHPNDDVNMAQSTNDTFPVAMHVAAATALRDQLVPAIRRLSGALAEKAKAWKGIVKIGRTHLQDATPITLGQEFSGYAAMLADDLARLEQTLPALHQLTLGGTAVGTGITAAPGFDQAATAEVAKITGLPFVVAPNKFAAQGAHGALVQLSATMKTLAASLMKIANDIRLLASGPRSGLGELVLPANEPGSSIMPGKVNPTQCEMLAMVAIQAMANDVAVAFGSASGHLEMNAAKPLIISNVLHTLRILADGAASFEENLVRGMEPDCIRIAAHLARSLMLVTALAPRIGYDKAAEVAHYAVKNDLTLREAALALKAVTAEEFDRLVDPATMV